MVFSAKCQPLQYPPPDPLWTTDSLGNRRAVIQVDEDAEAILAHIEWRRSDTLFVHNAIYVVDSTTDQQIKNVYRQNVSATAGDIVFEPVSGPGIYYIYYMPYRLTGRRNYPTAVYPRFRDQADPEWLNTWKHRHAPATGTDEIPEGTSVRIEAVNPFNAMSPMEHPMSALEQNSFVRSLGKKPYYLFPAGRKYPYILKKQLPKILENWSPSPTSWGSGHVISQESMSSLNTQGIAYDGIPFSKHIDVAPGNLQPLWILIDVTSETVPGTYHGLVEVQPENEESQSIEVQLEILEETVDDHGVNEPWLQTRLTWLNSTLYQDDTVIPPYTPVNRDNLTFSILGREVELNESGFPAQIQSYFNSAVTLIREQPLLFSEPIQSTGRIQQQRQFVHETLSLFEAVVVWRVL